MTEFITGWIKNRLAERSTFDGAVIAGIGVAIIVLGPLTKVLAYCAIAYGAYTMWRKG